MMPQKNSGINESRHGRLSIISPGTEKEDNDNEVPHYGVEVAPT